MSEAPLEDQPRTRRQSQRTKKSRVVTYLAILFAAAFLLLLLSYLMQQRANEQTITDLTQSLTSVHSLENLVTVNAQLQAENEQLQGELDAAKAAVQEASEAAGRQVRTVTAMEYFWQIDDYYARGYYGQARTLIEQFEPLGLKDALPTQNNTGTDRFSPADRYQEIYDALY